MNVTFRYATAHELPGIGGLIAHSFPRRDHSATQWYEQLRDPVWGGGAETVWVGEAEGRVVAACQLHPLQAWVAGEALPTMGLGTVAISPAHRKRGLAGRLVAAGLRAARERGDLATALYPFRAAFYGKLGYGLAGEALQYRFAPDSLPDAPERTRVELVDSSAGRAEVADLYGEWAPGQTGQLVRSAGVWESLLAPPERALFAYRAPGGGVEGYALVSYRTDLAPPERYLEVEELVWTTSAARRGLYAWLGSLGDQWRQIVLRALPAHRFGDWLRDARLPWGAAPGWGLWFPTATLLLGPMFRLLDVHRAWERRAVDPEAALTVAIRVTDAQLAENHGAWRLRLEAGRVGVERGAAGAADLALELDVATLSRLFVGALPVSAAVEAGLVAVEHAERLPELDRALRLPQPWTFDRF